MKKNPSHKEVFHPPSLTGKIAAFLALGKPAELYRELVDAAAHEIMSSKNPRRTAEKLKSYYKEAPSFPLLPTQVEITESQQFYTTEAELADFILAVLVHTMEIQRTQSDTIDTVRRRTGKQVKSSTR